MKILHGFADHGTESEPLSAYGDVVRATIDPRPNPYSAAIQADLSDPDELPFDEDEFDLAVLHPPCTAYSDMPGADKDGDAPRLVPEAREIGRRYATEYVVENKPAAPLENPTVLSGKMFGLPIQYERAFETSFHLPQPSRPMQTPETEASPFYYSEQSAAWWTSVKGLRGSYPKEHVAKNALPSPYVDHIVRAYLRASGRAGGVSDFSDYERRTTTAQKRQENSSLTEYAATEK